MAQWEIRKIFRSLDQPAHHYQGRIWNSINVVAAKYHTPNERTRAGIINQIWNCFETLWGVDTNNWANINGDNRWINDNNDIRNIIAHGAIPVEIEYVENVITRLDAVQKVANKFLIDWADSQLYRPLINGNR